MSIHLDHLRDELAARENTITGLTATVAEQNATIATLRDTVATQTADIATLHTTIANLRRQRGVIQHHRAQRARNMTVAARVALLHQRTARAMTDALATNRRNLSALNRSTVIAAVMTTFRAQNRLPDIATAVRDLYVREACANYNLNNHYRQVVLDQW